MSNNPLKPLVVALATWLSLVPLGALVSGSTHLAEAGLLVAIVGILGALGAVVGLPRGATYTLQIIATLGVLLWRGLALAPGEEGVVARLTELTLGGMDAIATSAPPVEPVGGLVWLILLLAALVLLVLELLVNVLEQPAWAFAPLSLSYVITAIAAREELTLWMLAVVGAAFVMLLLTSTGIGEGHRAARASRQGSFHLTRIVLAAVLTIVAVGAAAVVEPLLPMGSKQPWQSADSGPIQLGDPTVALNENLRRPQDQPMFTYRTSDDAPQYFRTVAMPDLTNDGARLVPMSLRSFGLADAYDAPGERVDVEVEMRAVPSEYLPVPFAVDEFQADGEWSYDPQTLTVVATGPERMEQTVNLVYSASSTVPAPGSEELDLASAGDDVDPITTVVPEVDDAVVTLTSSVVSGAATDGEKAQAIQAFLRSAEFEYSLDAPETATLDVISSFLLEERTGYCIHFAAAMMTMSRIEGIPSRMAVGFNSGSRQDDGTFLVTSHNMHAWPELYFDDLGWVPFEPTPSVASAPSYTDGEAAPAPAEPTPSPSPTPTPQAPEEPQTPSAPPTPESPDADRADSSTSAWVLGALAGLLGLALLAALPMLARAGMARWRLRGGQDPTELAAGAWREVRATFADTGRDWPDGSPGPAAEKAATTLRDGDLLQRIATTVEQATFARDGVDTSQLPDQVAALRKSLYADAPWWARAWPRSLWRTRQSL
ncbi:MAG: transglutaminase domain-containing protein [Propionibacterium sp.]|nr:transglutaminase domain-containing protein [Propionibacterium sp.]